MNGMRMTQGIVVQNEEKNNNTDFESQRAVLVCESERDSLRKIFECRRRRRHH